MKRLGKHAAFTALAASVAALAIAGCGSNNSSTSNTNETLKETAGSAEGGSAATGSLSTKLTTTLDEWSIKGDAAAVKSGSVKVTADNVGAVPHEVVFLKTDTPAGQLKVTNGEVSEKDSVGDVADIAGGKSKTGTLDLKPGKYVLVCNIAGHYEQGMYTSLVVK